MNCPRNFTKEQMIEGLKAGRTLNVDRKDAPELDDLLELGAGRVVVNRVGRIWACEGRRDGDQVDGDFHGMDAQRWRGWWKGKPGARGAGAGAGAFER